MDEDAEETYDMPWMEIPEDTSVPFPYQLNEIIMKGPEISALDHEHWEKLTFTELKDPEYQHVASGRIDWTIDHLNGTREAPNKAAIMRSSTVRIGGYDWRIKLFPRGNNTDYLSIYIECCSFTSTASDQIQGEVAKQHTPIPLFDNETQPVRQVATAQISVVLYNPAEPRVHKHHTASHGFWKENSDWGWNRFVPRYDMYRRSPDQRQALVRNDTIAMSAYIRVIEDSTGCYSEKILENPDSAALTGLRPICDPNLNRRPETGTLLVSILASWLLYYPFRDILYDCVDMDWSDRYGPRSRRLLYALQCVLYDLKRSFTCEEHRGVSISIVVAALQYYGFDTALPYDTALLIERIYFILSEEVKETPLEAVAHDIFEITPQPEDTQRAASIVQRVCIAKHSDLQSAVSASNLYTPQLLQIELKRHLFNPQTRQWVRDMKYIKLPDILTVSDKQYVLYGFITHKGDLRAGSARPIIRPGGPGTKWFAYEKLLNHDRVTCITQRAAEKAAGDGAASSSSELAHVLFYVRDDTRDLVFGDHFETAWDLDTTDNKEPGEPDISFAEFRTYQLDVFDSRGIVGHEGHGCFRYADLVATIPCKYVKPLKCGGDTTGSALTKTIATMLDVKDVRQVNVWIADMCGGETEGIPNLYPLLPDEPLADALRRPHQHLRQRGFERDAVWSKKRIFHLWVHITPLEDLPSKETAPPKTLGDAAPTIQEDAGEGPSVALRGVPRESTPVQTTGQNDPVQTIAETDDTASGTPSEGTTTSTTSTSDRSSEEPDNSLVSPRRSRPPYNTDVERRRKRNQECTSNPKEIKYFVLKTYDPRALKLTIQGSYLRPAKKSLVKAVRKILNIDSETGMTLWEERSWAVKRVSRGCLLEDAYTTDDSLCFIAQVDGTSSEDKSYPAGVDGTVDTDQVNNEDIDMDKFKNDGIDMRKYFECLETIRTSPWLADNKVVFDYMSRPYYKGPMKFALYHGLAETTIYDDGSMYTGGSYHLGRRHGQGHLIYPNGDTYTGTWAQDQRHGYGLFIESTSGNDYIGNWRHDKRHGEGVAHYKRAEYSENSCRVCWEARADAVFVPCGHVVCCLACARQVDLCPFCRVSAREAIRVYLVT